jgi:RNA polymerase sigma factor (TIGR02999 family)
MNQPPRVSLPLDELLPVVYDELHRLAKAKISGEKPGQTLQTTGLVHEAFLKIARYHDGQWRSERDFVAAAAQAMRQVLVDRARAKLRVRRKATRLELPLSEIPAGDSEESIEQEAVDLDRALMRLEQQDPEKADLVKLKYFVGMSLEEAAATLDISRARAYRQWNLAKALLKKWIYEANGVENHDAAIGVAFGDCS